MEVVVDVARKTVTHRESIFESVYGCVTTFDLKCLRLGAVVAFLKRKKVAWVV
jgi:hypothetical protein